MLSSKSVDIRKKTCAIISFIYDNIDPNYFKEGKYKIKNSNHSDSLSHMLWGSSLDKLSVDKITPYVYHTGRKTSEPVSKKKMRYLLSTEQGRYLFNQTNYLEISEGLLEDYNDCNISRRLCNNSTPWGIVKEYKQYLIHRFINKGKHAIRSYWELEELLRQIKFDPTKYYIDINE
jgi:hypothetical protein